MRRSMADALSIICEIDNVNTRSELGKSILRRTKQFGVTSLFGGFAPARHADPAALASCVFFSELPKEWSKYYFARNYSLYDPTVHKFLASSNAFDWREVEREWYVAECSGRVMNEARDAGLKSGFTVPLIPLDNRKAAISFAGDQIDDSIESRAILSLIANYALAKDLKFQLSPHPPIQPKVSKREQDILNWVAEGKTDWEIATILGISVHTVDKFVRQLKKKFNCVNRTQTIVIAMKNGLLG
ncbi:MAG: LuxR family transcriptional regulator [Alphaproteobacteria bacterium]|nr:LuxR family transcriptional regulator [Alphaproteobacteria bacterium]